MKSIGIHFKQSNLTKSSSPKPTANKDDVTKNAFYGPIECTYERLLALASVLHDETRPYLIVVNMRTYLYATKNVGQ